jgi:L-ascorbate metabolism protein UlaG (beta-lactamase superfamily)
MIPEMAAIKADVALVPVGGTYTMTVEQAAKAVSGFAPKVAVPMHCGDIVGTFGDREAFSKAAGVPVVILDPQ